MDLYLNVQNATWSPGKKKIGSLLLPEKFKDALLKAFAYFMSVTYAEEVFAAINDQRFINTWKPLSERYKQWKQAMGWSTNIWECTGLLKNSIGYWKITDPFKGWAVGIKKDVTYETETGKILSVRDVAMWMEYGTGEQAEGDKGKAGFPGMPPRPLFRPIQARLSRDVGKYYKKFLKDYDEEIDELMAKYLLGWEIK